MVGEPLIQSTTSNFAKRPEHSGLCFRGTYAQIKAAMGVKLLTDGQTLRQSR